jgi:hypothetical protein
MLAQRIKSILEQICCKTRGAERSGVLALPQEKESKMRKLVLLLTLAVSPLCGQTPKQGLLRVVIKDQTGTFLQGALVRLEQWENRRLDPKLTLITEQRTKMGEALQVPLPPGDYNLFIAAPGLAATAWNIRAEAGKVNIVFVVLRPLVGVDINVLAESEPEYVAIVKGTIRDPMGAVIANAEVTVQCKKRKDRCNSSTSDPEGRYVLKTVRGNHEIWISSSGFKTQKRKEVLFAGEQTIDVVLEVSSDSKVIE